MNKQKMSDPVDTPVSDDVEAVFEVRINELVTRLEENAKESKAIANEFKILKKDHVKIVKKIVGTRRKKVPRDPDAPKKAPSGFAKPTKISSELATFLGVSEGEMIARPDVTKGITKYVKEHNLQKEENKRIIDLTKPGGSALVDLLNIPDGEELTFFNLQKYLKIHFPISEKEPKVPKEKSTVKKVTEDTPVQVKTKKPSSKKVVEPTEEVAAPAAPAAPAAKVVKSSKVKQVKTVVEDVEEVQVEDVPVEEVKPRKRRPHGRVEETS